jgi:ribosome maturation factor RimP
MTHQKILNLVNEAITENKNLFVVELNINKNNKIELTLDGDNGISLQECIKVSRFVENNLDREEEDFSIEVGSPNIAEALKTKRQYNKNIGRIVKVKTETDKFEGELVAVTKDNIKLQWKAREAKPIGKGKITVEKEATITFDDIKETKVKIIF